MVLLRNRIQRFVGSAIFAAIIGSPPSQSAHAQDPAGAMPLEVTERLWLDPGPDQSEPGAPKILIVYPKDTTKISFGGGATRYAGRVEPVDSVVTIDEETVKVWPGGVFTGLLPLLEAGEHEVVITATHGGKSTTVTRKVARLPRALGPRPWPPAFHPGSPVVPEGKREFWLRPGSQLKVRLRASAGNDADVRVGSGGPWIVMDSVQATPEEGGAYEAVIVADAAMSATESAPLHFRISSLVEAGRPPRAVQMVSKLSVKRLPEETELYGRVDDDFATFLKNAEGFQRWGNWLKGAAFPVRDLLGDRISVDFGQGETGFVETASVRLLTEPPDAPLPVLGSPKVEFVGASTVDRVILRWEGAAPVASVFHAGPPGEPGELNVSLPGAQSAEPAAFEAPPGSFIRRVEVFAGGAAAAPSIKIELAERELWGYGFRRAEDGGLELTVRARPDPPSPEPSKPLGGLRIMIDAGHGGRDFGALGPSGLTEADVNLVLAAHLQIQLENLGAEIRQTRMADSYVSLDDRVRDAIGWTPDLFISVHHNSVSFATDPMKDSGPKVYYHYEHARALAGAVAAELSGLLTPEAEPRVLSQVFRVNRNLSPCPSILVEGGFVCNPVDEVQLRNAGTLKAMAGAIARGVVNLMAPE